MVDEFFFMFVLCPWRVRCYETPHPGLYFATLREQPQFVVGQCIVQECELAFVCPFLFFCFIFSQRLEVWHFVNADCERRQWLQRQAFW
jgi:hypothetical protein